MAGSYPRTENQNYDERKAEIIEENQRRLKAMEKSLPKRKKSLLDSNSLQDLINEHSNLSSKDYKESEKKYSKPAQEVEEHNPSGIDVSRIDDPMISTYQPKPGNYIKSQDEIGSELLVKLEILNENNNLPNYKDFCSMPKYTDMSEKERVEIYLEYRQGLISKMRAERDEGYNLIGFEADPTGRPLTKTEKAQQYLNINKVMEKGFSKKALDKLANHNVDATQMTDPEQKGITISKNDDMKIMLFKAKDGGIKGLVETENGTYVTPSRYEGVDTLIDGKTLEEAMNNPNPKVAKDYSTVTQYDNDLKKGDLKKGIDEIKAWTAILEQEGVHCEFSNRYNTSFTDGINSDFRENGITHFFNTGGDKSKKVAGKIKNMIQNSFSEKGILNSAFQNNEVSYYWERTESKNDDFFSNVVNDLNEQSASGFKASFKEGSKSILIEINKEGFKNSFTLNFKQLDLDGGNT